MVINRIKAEGTASNLLERYGYSNPKELVLEDLAYALGIRVRKRPMDNIEGCLLRLGKSGVILINTKAIPDRQRFTLAHEIGHWELHPDLQQKMCSAEDMRDYYRSSEEVEANHFAASLLLPKQWVSCMGLMEDPSFSRIQQIANNCNVSLTCTSRRYTELTSQPVVLISSRNGKVEWSIPSSNSENFRVCRGFPIHQYTSTFECISEREDRRDMEVTESRLWYPDKGLDEDFEIYEEVWNIPTYGYCLTLLWLPGLL